MEITFKNSKLEKRFMSEKGLVKHYGPEMAKKISGPHVRAAESGDAGVFYAAILNAGAMSRAEGKPQRAVFNGLKTSIPADICAGRFFR